MYCSGHIRILLLTAAIFLPGPVSALPQSTSIQVNTQANTTDVHLRWGPRPGVSRYRLQLASDNAFTGIVFDRVVAGTPTLLSSNRNAAMMCAFSISVWLLKNNVACA